MIAHKDGGEVITTRKEEFVETVVNHDVRMIVGARNKSLVECWIHYQTLFQRGDFALNLLNL